MNTNFDNVSAGGSYTSKRWPRKKLRWAGAAFCVLVVFGSGLANGQESFLTAADPSASASDPDVLYRLITGLLLGTCGQVARSVVGIKKEMDLASVTGKKWKDWFNMAELMISLLLGGVAGVFAAVAMMDGALDSRFIIGCIAAGYAGSDFIQGFMSRNLPEGALVTPAPATQTANPSGPKPI